MSSFFEADLPEKMFCPTCGELRSVKRTKKNKPFWQCDDCLVQVFVRGSTGIKYLKQLKNNPELINKFNKDGNKTTMGTILKLSEKIEFIKSEIQKIEGDNFIFPEKGEISRKEQLQTLLNEAETKYFEFLKGF